jgi:hypothetical protein
VVYALRHAPLPGEWHLFWDRREAPGVVTRFDRREQQDRKKGLQISHTYHYTFQLPDGRQVQGQSTSDGAQPVVNMPRLAGKGQRVARPVAVTVEYHPRHVEANRVKGTRCDSGGPFVLFGLLLPAASLALLGFGLWAARTEVRLLRKGEPALAYINACRLPSRKGGRAQVGGVSMDWSGPANAYQPLADFLASVRQEHQAALDWARGTQQSKFVAGCAAVFAFWFAGTFGLVLSGLVAAFWLVPMLGFGPNDPRPVFVTAGVVGLLCGGVAALWARRRYRASAAAVPVGGRSPALDRVECQLAFYLADGETVGETTRTLRLADGPEDEEPRVLLYDPARPSRTLLYDELTAATKVDEQGAWACDRPWPLGRAVLVAAALPLPLLAWLWA